MGPNTSTTTFISVYRGIPPPLLRPRSCAYGGNCHYAGLALIASSPLKLHLFIIISVTNQSCILAPPHKLAFNRWACHPHSLFHVTRPPTHLFLFTPCCTHHSHLYDHSTSSRPDMLQYAIHPGLWKETPICIISITTSVPA